MALALLVGIALSVTVHIMGIVGMRVPPAATFYLQFGACILGPITVMGMLLTADEVRLDEPGKPYGEAFFEEWPNWLIGAVGATWIYAIAVELLVPVTGFWISSYVTMLAFLYVSERAVRSAEIVQRQNQRPSME